MYRHFAISVIGVLGFVLVAFPLKADVIVGAPGNPGAGDCLPFGCSLLDPSGTSAVSSDYQQIFDKSLFSGPIAITGLTFFLKNFDNIAAGIPNTFYPADYSITLSLSSIPVNGLDSTLENNIDPATAQTFYVGTPADPTPGADQFTIPGNSFVYDPSKGNLLLDIRTAPTDSTDLSFTMFPDSNANSGGLFSSAFDSDPHPVGCPDGSAGLTTGCTNSNSGLVVEFNTPLASPVPEPATIWLGLSVLGTIGMRSGRSRERRRE